MRIRSIARAGIAVAAIVVASSTGFAQNAVVNACVNPVTGAIRVVSAGSSCRANESPLSLTVGGPQGPQDNRLFTVGTVGAGTAQDLTVPDLGTLRVECSADNLVASVTLTGSALFDITRVEGDPGNGVLARFDLTTYDNHSAESFGFFGSELWLKNVQGQWRFEYYALAPRGENVCRAGAVITRMN